MGCSMGTAQLNTRMENSGRRHLTGEPTFLTQVPKESDANTPSALSIAFIYCLLRIQSPLGEGSSLGTMGSACSLLGCIWGWDQGTIPGGSSHSPAFANIHRELVVATYPQQQVCVLFFFSLPHFL
uniref:Uncharacterized protein n=1 Tax=Rousettus aegyptiacus TaxID=9407 RepID=A0A7J8KAT7_ROUAE|nr:hypothetical protein HJG63_007819 [Rousettus aegyptiacus]